MTLQLRWPREDEKQEFLRAHRATSPEHVTFLHYYEEGMPFRRYLDVLAEQDRGVNLPSAQHVPSTFLFAFVAGRIVGRVSIRHRLNDFLLEEGGHIGYAVVPEFRRRGYATEILRQALPIARAKAGSPRILVTCDDDNVGSIRTIEKNGGVLEDVRTRVDGVTPVRRYWFAPASDDGGQHPRGAEVDETLRAELVAMARQDRDVRSELAAEGTLEDGYHPRMAAVHDANGARLSAIIDAHGWPTEALAGADGAKAAHLIAQHAINHPDFMRRCRQLLDEASACGDVPRWQYALIDDRIRAYEGQPQRFGTQWRGGPDGLEPYPIEDPAHVDERRAALGLPPLAELRASGPPKRPWDPDAARRREAGELAWRREVGWILPA